MIIDRLQKLVNELNTQIPFKISCYLDYYGKTGDLIFSNSVFLKKSQIATLEKIKEFLKEYRFIDMDPTFGVGMSKRYTITFLRKKEFKIESEKLFAVWTHKF